MAVTFRVFRYDPDDGKGPHFQDYQVQNEKGMTVLEGIFWIMENADPTLAFRCACRAAICGSDAMHINSKYRLACQTQIDRLKPPIVIRPLAHLPVQKDLVVDMQPFFDTYIAIKPYLIPGTRPRRRNIFRARRSARNSTTISTVSSAGRATVPARWLTAIPSISDHTPY